MELKGRKHLLKILTSLGLSKDHAMTYLTVMQLGSSGVSSVAREMGTGRTKAHRLMEELTEKNLLSKVEQSPGAVYSAMPYSNLRSLIEVRESELKDVKKSFESLGDLFEKASEDKAGSVISYSGMDGLKQVIWNTTKAKRVLKVFEVSRLNVFMDFGFSEDVRMHYLKNKIKTKDITNEPFIQGWTDIKEFVEKYAECRYVSSDNLEMSFEIYIYNDVVTLIDYRSNTRLFCLEIINPLLQHTMGQLFDFVWERAQEMEITGPRGQLEVKK